ncbi:MAG: prepilin peptidase [Clostridiaceae bacterium]|nr:prepilin peptidase [Clostridiaceae bacterium]
MIVDRSEEKYSEDVSIKKKKTPQNNNSWVTGRSHCQSCGKNIRWYDNIPLLSYLLLGGKCRFCKIKIGLDYPLVELFTGILFVFIGFLYLSTPAYLNNHVFSFLFLLIFIVFLWLILLFDLKYMIIPDELVILVGSLAVIKIVAEQLFNAQSFFFNDLVVATLLLLFFLMLRYLPLLILKKYGLGWGDIKLVFPLAMVLGYKLAIVGIFCAFIIGGVWGIILLITRRAKTGQMISFGPFLVLGSLIALAWGADLWQAYWQLL